MGRRPAYPRACPWSLLLVLALATVVRPSTPRPGAVPMLEPHTASLLVGYYEAFLIDQDISTFSLSVSTRYTPGTLARLIQAGDVTARRAAVLALGLVGDMEVNAAVGRALRDPDPAVRNLAHNALWAIWFRADSPENNATLQEVSDLIRRGQAAEAERLATRLIGRAPRFAEAYNQRAIALFEQERFGESAEDCRRALELNPYHIGALGGLGQCCLRLGNQDAALATFQRALKLQPYNQGLRQYVSALGGQDE